MTKSEYYKFCKEVGKRVDFTAPAEEWLQTQKDILKVYRHCKDSADHATIYSWFVDKYLQPNLDKEQNK